MYDLKLNDMIENTQDANLAFGTFHEHIINVFDKHAPIMKRKQRYTDLPLMTQELKRAIYRRNISRNKYFKYHTPHYHAVYKKHRNEVTSITRQSIRAHFLKECTGGALNGGFWKAIKPFFMKTAKYHPQIMLRENDEIISEETQCVIYLIYISSP